MIDKPIFNGHNKFHINIIDIDKNFQRHKGLKTGASSSNPSPLGRKRIIIVRCIFLYPDF